MHRTYNLHVVDTRPLLSPATVHGELPLSESAAEVVQTSRSRIRNILNGTDKRLLVVVGPCSIHEVQAAKDYAQKLLKLREELQDSLEIVMRVYFEKPRTTVGWKGLINDPHLDGSFDINTGIRLARKLLLDLAHMGMPSATELLDPIVPQYLADIIAWTAIGARTTESQIHRQMASGLSMPVGYKNSTDSSVGSAVNAIAAAKSPHHFLGINWEGKASIVATTGNPDGHLILRGGRKGTNFDRDSVDSAAAELHQQGAPSRIMIDCSHGNSNKDHRNQPVVLQEVGQQVQQGSPNVMGVMVESHLVEGKQPIPDDLSTLTYGQSITDSCVNLDTTADMLRSLAENVQLGRFATSAVAK
ncbi:MAG: 3-deoxy-7-phosphoheptulonate synthase [Cyanobacteria bacterium J06597_1]